MVTTTLLPDATPIETPDAPRFACACGTVAPRLPEAGAPPVACETCRSPLVSPERLPVVQIEFAFGAALLVGVAMAAAWTAIARATASGATWFALIAAVLIAIAAFAAAGGRARLVQAAALTGFAGFLAVGEALIYRHALAARILAMHVAEQASDAALAADREMRAMDIWKYLAIEVDLTFCIVTAASCLLLWRITQPPRALVAFRVPEPSAADAPPRVGTGVGTGLGS